MLKSSCVSSRYLLKCCIICDALRQNFVAETTLQYDMDVGVSSIAIYDFVRYVTNWVTSYTD